MKQLTCKKYGLSIIIFFILLISGRCIVNYYFGCPTCQSESCKLKRKSAAISRMLAIYPPVEESLDSTGQSVMFKRPSDFIPYKSETDFLKKNPYCCSEVMVGAEGWKPSFYQRITGKVSAIVNVKYKLSEHGLDQNQSEYRETYIVFSGCADIADY